MTDENIVGAESVSNSVPVESEKSNVNVSTPTQPNLSDYVPKTRVQELIHERTKAVSEKAYERGKQEALANQTNQQNNIGLGGMPISEDRFRSMMAEEFKKQAQEYARQHEETVRAQQMQSAADNFVSKLKQSNPDLLKRSDDLMGLSELVPYLNETSEVGKITQHLLDNEGVFANLIVLNSKSPSMVRSALKKIENRIKENTEALNQQYPREPLSQVTPSINAMDNEASGSIEALKKQSWLKG